MQVSRASRGRQPHLHCGACAQMLCRSMMALPLQITREQSSLFLHVYIRENCVREE